MVLVFVVTGVLCAAGCGKNDANPAGDPTPKTAPIDPPKAEPPKTEVPAELVGTWEHGSIDFALWENYKQDYYAGRNAAPSREAMVIRKDGSAKFYRYEFAFGLYEELIDCEGMVAVADGTFTFTPVKGRKRHFDTRHAPNNKDRALTDKELSDPKLAGKRRYTVVAKSDPPTLRITVPSSAPYNWYKKP